MKLAENKNSHSAIFYRIDIDITEKYLYFDWFDGENAI